MNVRPRSSLTECAAVEILAGFQAVIGELCVHVPQRPLEARVVRIQGYAVLNQGQAFYQIGEEVKYSFGQCRVSDGRL
jgi:hypothetical protein